MQLAILGHALYGGQGLPLGLDGEHRAALDGLAVDQDGARAALARVTADVRSGEAHHISQVVDEKEPGLDLVLLFVAIDGGRDLVLHTTPPHLRWRRSRAPKTVS